MSRYSKLLVCHQDNKSLNIPCGPIPNNDEGSNINENGGPIISCLKGKEVAPESSCLKNKLPHWLREAVGGGASCSKSTPGDHPQLPPIVSAIAESVRLLYAEEKPAIPPFVPPGSPPPPPKDPRKMFKKKKKIRRSIPGMVQSDGDGDNSLASGSTSMPMPPPPLPTPPSSSSSFSEPIGKASSELSPSPVVPHNKEREPQELGQEGNKETERLTSQHDSGVEGSRSGDGDSGKTQSDPPHVEPPGPVEISSEKTVSDDQTG